MRLERQNPLNGVGDLGLVLGLDYFVFFFIAVDLDFWTGGDVREQLLLRIRLTLVFLGNFLVGRAVLLLVNLSLIHI